MSRTDWMWLLIGICIGASIAWAYALAVMS